MKLEKGDEVATDFDATLATYDGPAGGPLALGDPIEKHVDRVKGWLKDGIHVEVFTAKINVDDPELRMLITLAIHAWCKKHLGVVLAVTDRKKGTWKQIWDDRTVRVVSNTGKVYPGADDEA